MKKLYTYSALFFVAAAMIFISPVSAQSTTENCGPAQGTYYDLDNSQFPDNADYCINGETRTNRSISNNIISRSCGTSSCNTSDTQIVPVDATCNNTVDGQSFPENALPTVSGSDLCTAGTYNYNKSISNNKLSWSCDGIDGGEAASCEATITNVVDAKCGAIHGGSYPENDLPNTSADTLCIAGDYSYDKSISDGKLTWSCTSNTGGNDKSCEATITNVVDAKCGAIHGNSYPENNLPDTSADTLCIAGDYSYDKSISDGKLTWSCTSNTGGNDKSCEATITNVVDGKCGADHQGTLADGVSPDTTCIAGTPTDPTLDGDTRSWMCDSNSGGSASTCTATVEENNGGTDNINGQCGADDQGTLADGVSPDTTCMAGTPTDAVLTDGTRSWMCTGANNGSDDTCTASIEEEVIVPTPIDGVCGADHQGTLADGVSPDTSCQTGTPTDPTLDGDTRSWMCTGANNGSDDTCTASVEEEVIVVVPTPNNQSSGGSGISRNEEETIFLPRNTGTTPTIETEEKTEEEFVELLNTGSEEEETIEPITVVTNDFNIYTHISCNDTFCRVSYGNNGTQALSDILLHITSDIDLGITYTTKGTIVDGKVVLELAELGAGQSASFVFAITPQAGVQYTISADIIGEEDETTLNDNTSVSNLYIDAPLPAISGSVNTGGEIYNKTTASVEAYKELGNKATDYKTINNLLTTTEQASQMKIVAPSIDLVTDVTIVESYEEKSALRTGDDSSTALFDDHGAILYPNQSTNLESGKTIIGAHSTSTTDTVHAGLFKDLSKIEKGNQIYVYNTENNKTSTYIYEVTQTFEIESKDLSTYTDQSDEATLRLFSCVTTPGKTLEYKTVVDAVLKEVQTPLSHADINLDSLRTSQVK